jgi:uncharacterized protein YndB with AHSA1/START domain
VPSEELDPILVQVTVPLPIPMIYAAFLEPSQLAGWLCDAARVKPEVGGEYALSWTAPVAFESGGRILQMERDRDLGFSWFGPPEFAAVLNEPESKTHVYVRLQESPEGIDVTLEHAGWVSGEAWEAARSWHFHLWDDRLHRLKDYLIKAAYG